MLIEKDYQTLCPVCSFEYNHVLKVDVFSGPDDYEATGGFLTVTASAEGQLHLTTPLVVPKSDRRYRGQVGLEIFYWCENHHLWTRKIRHHKGCSDVTDSSDGLQHGVPPELRGETK